MVHLVGGFVGLYFAIAVHLSTVKILFEKRSTTMCLVLSKLCRGKMKFLIAVFL